MNLHCHLFTLVKRFTEDWLWFTSWKLKYFLPYYIYLSHMWQYNIYTHFYVVISPIRVRFRVKLREEKNSSKRSQKFKPWEDLRQEIHEKKLELLGDNPYWLKPKRVLIYDWMAQGVELSNKLDSWLNITRIIFRPCT